MTFENSIKTNKTKKSGKSIIPLFIVVALIVLAVTQTSFLTTRLNLPEIPAFNNAAGFISQAKNAIQESAANATTTAAEFFTEKTQPNAEQSPYTSPYEQSSIPNVTAEQIAALKAVYLSYDDTAWGGYFTEQHEKQQVHKPIELRELSVTEKEHSDTIKQIVLQIILNSGQRVYQAQSPAQEEQALSDVLNNITVVLSSKIVQSGAYAYYVAPVASNSGGYIVMPGKNSPWGKNDTQNFSDWIHSLIHEVGHALGGAKEPMAEMFSSMVVGRERHVCGYDYNNWEYFTAKTLYDTVHNADSDNAPIWEWALLFTNEPQFWQELWVNGEIHTLTGINYEEYVVMRKTLNHYDIIEPRGYMRPLLVAFASLVSSGKAREYHSVLAPDMEIALFTALQREVFNGYISHFNLDLSNQTRLYEYIANGEHSEYIARTKAHPYLMGMFCVHGA